MNSRDAIVNVMIDQAREHALSMEDRDLFPTEVELLKVMYQPRVERFIQDMQKELTPIIRELFRRGGL